MEGPPLILRGDVGALAGDIRHDADITVIGNVLPGCTISAGGDVLVHGNVDRARIQAGGDITVRGIAGGSGAVLDAVGSVELRQAQDARVIAGLDIEIHSAAERCSLVAGRTILALGFPGLLRGGVQRAGLGVEALRIERSAGRCSRIEVGRAPFDASRRDLADRLAFALSRVEKTKRIQRTAPNGRRQVADLAVYRHLARELSRQIRQVDVSSATSGSPYVNVLHVDPLDAEFAFGEDGKRAPRLLGRRPGAFAAVMRGGEITVEPIQEGSSVG